MSCTACGDEPKNTAKDFTKAVIEINNPEQIVMLRKLLIPASMGDDKAFPPVVGKYRNLILAYEASENVYIYSSDGIPTKVTGDLESIRNMITNEKLARRAADDVLQQEIEDIKNAPDVVDIVGTYADLMAYDTSDLGDKDVIRVLVDETHDSQSTYYRWSASSSTWTYIGAVGPYYTKDQTDALLAEKQDTLTAGTNIDITGDVISATDTTYSAGTNIQISPQNVISATDTTYTAGTNVQINGTTISATDTTYSDFTGTDGTAAGVAGLVPAPATTDADKFLKSDGTWATAGGGGGGAGYTVLTTADYNWNNTAKDSTTQPLDSIALWLLDPGTYQWNPGNAPVVRYGTNSGDVITTPNQLTVLVTVGEEQTVTSDGETLAGVHPLRVEMFGIDPDEGVYTTSATIGYTMWSSVYDEAMGLLYPYAPSVVANLTSTSDTDALAASQGKELKDLVDGLVISGTGAPTISTVGTIGKLYEDKTNGKLYICTDATNPYVWQEVGAGGGASAFTTAEWDALWNN